MPKTKTCPLCDKVSPWTKNDVCSTCRVLYQRYKNRRTLIEEMGSECQECGEDDPVVLQFHHIDASTKSFTISSKLQCGIDRLRDEARKCILLCANCHTRLHDNETDREKVIAYYEP